MVASTMVNFYEFRIAVTLIVTKYCPWPKNWNWLGHQQYLKGFLRVSEYYIHIWLLSTSGALTTIFVIWTTASEQSRHRSLADLEWPLEEDHATTTTTMLELIYYASYIWRRDFAIVLSFEYLNRPFCKQKISRRIIRTLLQMTNCCAFCCTLSGSLLWFWPSDL